MERLEALTIKNIIFDLGGVLYDINYEETFIQLSQLLGMNVRVGHWPNEFREAVFAYEVGKISTESFLNRMQRLSQKSITNPRMLIDAWNAMLIGWFPNIFPLLEKLSNQYRLFILSNISEIHVLTLERSLQEKGGRDYLREFFENIYFSNELGIRKPDVNAFRKILYDNKLKPGETVFIDDYPSNFEEAKQIGIHCFVYEKKETLKKFLKNHQLFVC